MFRYVVVRRLIPADDIAGNLRVDQAAIDGVYADEVAIVAQQIDVSIDVVTGGVTSSSATF